MYKPELEDPELKFRERESQGNFQFFKVDLRAALRQLDNLEEKALAATAERQRKKKKK